MVHNPHKLSQVFETVPHNWPLVLVVGKRPIVKDWPNKQCDRSEILAKLESGKATGIGLKLGNGLLAIDIDGDSARDLLQKLAGSNGITAFSETTSWTSGRAGRKQCLFWVAEADWHRIKKLRISTGVSGEYLEFRWLGQQSVLPPSIHPDTGRPYEWINNPVEHPPALAPEWLIDLCENWDSEYAGIEKLPLVRFPVRLFKHFGGQMRVWLLARRFDISRWKHSGHSKGCGIGKFSLKAASIILNRDTKTILGLLRDAKKSGLIRNYKKTGDWVKVFYSSLEKAIALTDIEKLGPIAAIEVDELANLHIIATEVEAQYLQRAAFHRQRQEETQQMKAEGVDPEQKPTQLIAPSALHTCEQLARVLGRSERFMFCESGFRFYGGSQEAIANSRGISTSTVSRHLSNRHRLRATPIRGFRQELPPIVKKQLVERLPLLQNMPSELCVEDGLFLMRGEWWKPHCNVYLINHRLVSARRRRGRIQATIDKQALCVKNDLPGDLDNKFLLSDSFFSEKEVDRDLKFWGLKNQDKEKQK
ncbi:bifunctional DNA primase/polymerase [Microcoleus sp. herbarium7]